MKTLNRNQWIGVSVVLVGAVIFFGIGQNIARVFSSAFSSALERERATAGAYGSEFPELVSGEDGDLLIYDFKKGEGEAVRVGDTVAVHYVGFFLDGTPFDTSRSGEEPYRVTLGEGDVIEGWEKGLLGMQIGGQRRLIIPPHLAYGAEGYMTIPPNATLVFDIELVAIEE